MIFVRECVASPMNGNEHRMTNEKLHPLAKANAIPETVIENAMMMVPVFSPSALAIA